MADTSNYLKGAVEILMLGILRTGERYGYELVGIIKEKSDGLLDIPLGSLYPTLYRLLEKDYLIERKEIVGKRLRTYYAVSEAGIEYYNTVRESYNRVNLGVNNILKWSDGENR